MFCSVALWYSSALLSCRSSLFPAPRALRDAPEPRAVFGGAFLAPVFFAAFAAGLRAALRSGPGFFRFRHRSVGESWAARAHIRVVGGDRAGPLGESRQRIGVTGDRGDLVAASSGDDEAGAGLPAVPNTFP